MKILHTADWHLGHRLHERSQLEEQMQFLNWLVDLIIKEQVDVLLIAGDVFDTGIPSSQSLKMYYDFLVKLTKTDCQHVVVTGGNHDSPGTLNAPKELLNALHIKVVGKATEEINEEVFKLTVDDQSLIVAAVPYLRDQDIRRAVEGESFDQITDRYKQALINHYSAVADYCLTIQDDETPILAMGHLFAVGGSISDSENSIYVGTLGHIGAADFPSTFDYVALGHLHRPQVVGEMEHIRYAGSPMALSFSEIGHDKMVLLLESSANKISLEKQVTIPKFRAVLRVSGTLAACLAALKEIPSSRHTLTPWVEVILDNDANANIGNQEINQAAEDLELEVLKVTLKNQRATLGLEQLTKQTRDICELKPMEVFEMKCKEQGFAIADHQEIFDAFSEAVQIATEQ